MPQNYITLPRSKLYELVWKTPVTELAKQFGISDVALAKRCRAINIPLPPRGYWARIAAGQKPRRPPLPPLGVERRRTGRSHHGASSPPSYVTTTRSTDASGGTQPEPAITFDPDRRVSPTASDDVDLPAITVAVTTDLTQASDLVKRTARHYKHPRRAELKFTRGEAHGPILRLHVSPASLDRALLLADTFLRAATEQGWSPIPPPEPEPPRYGYGRTAVHAQPSGPTYADLAVDGHRIQFQVEERADQRPLPPTPAELNRQKRHPGDRPTPRTDTVWSGHLRLKRTRLDYPYDIAAKSWYETNHRTLETLFPRILADFRAVATRMQVIDEEIAREQREHEEQERRQQALAERREANQKLIWQLEHQAGAWHRAQFLRRYVRAARRRLGTDTIILNLQGEPTDFLAWAEHYVDQLDPLSAADHDPDLMPERAYYSDADRDRLQGELRRLSGHTWARATKLIAEPPDHESDPDDDAEDDGDC